jgi:hypothetical protein
MTHPATAPQAREVTGGVDTHSDTHTAAALDPTERLLGHHQFPATPTGYTALLAWLHTFGHVVLVGIEGTGAYGAGLTGYLRTAGIALVEVDRPDRSTAATAASPTPSTPKPPPAPHNPGAPPVSRNTATARSKPYARSGWPAAARSPSALTPRPGSSP